MILIAINKIKKTIIISDNGKKLIKSLTDFKEDITKDEIEQWYLIKGGE